jgi:hypothetical protein
MQSISISRASSAHVMQWSLVSTCNCLQDDCARKYFLVPYIFSRYSIYNDVLQNESIQLLAKVETQYKVL